MVASKNGIEFLARVRDRSGSGSHAGQPTDSLRRFGRLDRYRLVEASSPSALSRALKLSWCCLISPGYAWKRTQSKTYPSKANLVAEMVEGPDALLRVANVGELGKPKAAKVSVRGARENKQRMRAYPLQAPVEVSMIALLCSTLPNREAYR